MKQILYILIAIGFYSCETDVTNDITLKGSTPRLVVNGGIERNTMTPLNEQKIELSTTVGFLEKKEPIPVTNASVIVNDGTDDFEFLHTANGVYVNDRIEAKLNTVYTINVQWNGETYTGKDFLSEVPDFDRVYAVFEEETLFTDQGYFLNFDSTDPANVDNYYYYRVFKNDEFTIVPDPGNNVTIIEKDQFFDGKSRVGINPNEEVSFEIGDKAGVQQLAISANYYNYLVELFTQTGSQGFSLIGNPPPASIRSNLININTPKNRVLGYFYAADVKEASLLISE